MREIILFDIVPPTENPEEYSEGFPLCAIEYKVI